MNGNEKFTLSQVSRYLSIKKVGRTIIYRILRELVIVDQTNSPVKKYIVLGYLAVGRPIYFVNGRQIHVTLAVGVGGKLYIGQVVRNYLKDHPIPRVKRKPKIDPTDI